MRNMRFLLLTLLALNSFVGSVSAYFHPDEGRWLSRDPMGDEAFYKSVVGPHRKVIISALLSSGIESADGQFVFDDPLYVGLGNDPLNRVDLLGLALTSLDGAIEACLRLPSPAARIKCLNDLMGIGCDDCKIKSLIEAQKRLMSKAGDLINGSLKRSPSYHSELEGNTYEKILELAKGKGDLAKRAQQMKKLIEQSKRLLEKCK